jgi:ATP/maltotriose-dependent transcriptional regulator MalT
MLRDRARTDLQASIEDSRRELVKGRVGDARRWREVIERSLRGAHTSADLDGLADTIQFMTHLMDADGRLNDAIAEVEHAIQLAHGAPTPSALLYALQASFLAATGKVGEANLALEAAEGLIGQVESACSIKCLVMAETVRFKLLKEPSPRFADIIAETARAGSQGDYLFLVSWYVPYLAARGEEGAARPLLRQGKAIAQSQGHRWRLQDMASFEAWKRAVDGEVDLSPVEHCTNQLAQWRQATLRVWSVSLRRQLGEVPAALKDLGVAHSRQGSADVGPAEAWQVWAAMAVGDVSFANLHPPREVSLSTLGTSLAAANAVAIAGSRSDAGVWLPWVRKLAARGVQSSLEWPVSLRRIEGLLWLRTGEPGRARKALLGAADWAASAGYPLERALAALQLAEVAAITQPGGREAWKAAGTDARLFLVEHAVDPVPHLAAVQSGVLLGRQDGRNLLTPRELEVLRLLGDGLPYKVIGARMGISWKTVRTMAHNVYEKLGVDGRQHAVTVGRELELL